VSDGSSLPSKDELERLSVRACVAYAVRASLRVRPLFWSGNPNHENILDGAHQRALNFIEAKDRTDLPSSGAIKIAKFYAAANSASDAAIDAAFAAAHAESASENAVVHASPVSATTSCDQCATAALDAIEHTCFPSTISTDSSGKLIAIASPDDLRTAFIAECRRDYQILYGLTGDAAGALGYPLKVEEDDGIFGPLWTMGEPQTLLVAINERQPTGNRFSLPNEDDLRRLTLRGCTSYASRAAMRVWPLFQTIDDHHQAAIDAANRIAIEFSGLESTNLQNVRAVADAARDASDNATTESGTAAALALYSAVVTVVAAISDGDDESATRDVAMSAALDAARAASIYAGAYNEIVVECNRDFEKLQKLSGDMAGELGDAVDVAGNEGPLGSLWPKGEPEWFNAVRKRDRHNCPPGEGDLPTEDELAHLSLRGCVAYAVRAAMRVRPLCCSDDSLHEAAVDEVIGAATNFVGKSGVEIRGVAEAASTYAALAAHE
jgi:hypothetical protein